MKLRDETFEVGLGNYCFEYDFKIKKIKENWDCTKLKSSHTTKENNEQ